jgi:membrane fusion protein, multidrug efflux system
MKQDSKKNRFKVYIPLTIVILIVLSGAYYWFRDYRTYITTDDAHVEADNITIGSKIIGRIVTLHAAEGDIVSKGQLLVELDSSDLIAQRDQAMALRSQAQASLTQSEIRYSSDQKSIRVQEINLEKAEEDLARAREQFSGGVITQEQFDHIKKAYESASAQLDAVKAQLSVSKSLISSAAAAVGTAAAQVNVLETQLKNTKLYAPAEGVIARRWLMPGDIVQPGQSVFTLTDGRAEWIVAYLEETKIGFITNGQDVKFTIDAYPHIKFYGKVFLVGASTANVFSLIPANNASGNFTKVTQRVPVKISIDKTEKGKELSSFSFLPGMSAVVKFIRKQNG